MKLEIGQRVRLRRNVERFPHFIAGAGLTGTVSYVDAAMVGVKMDEHIDGCEEWDNEVMWYAPHPSLARADEGFVGLWDDLEEDVEVLPD